MQYRPAKLSGCRDQGIKGRKTGPAFGQGPKRGGTRKERFRLLLDDFFLFEKMFVPEGNLPRTARRGIARVFNSFQRFREAVLDICIRSCFRLLNFLRIIECEEQFLDNRIFGRCWSRPAPESVARNFPPLLTTLPRETKTT